MTIDKKILNLKCSLEDIPKIWNDADKYLKLVDKINEKANEQVKLLNDEIKKLEESIKPQIKLIKEQMNEIFNKAKEEIEQIDFEELD